MLLCSVLFFGWNFTFIVSPTVNETGSQTWEQKFTGDEDNEEETGSQTWEKQFTGDDDDACDDEKKETETGSQTWEKNFEDNY